ncbi:MAG: chemotaxis protein CheW, partial [Acidobacteriaceae bacterium]
SRIELAGSRPVLRFEGTLLPLDDAAGAFAGTDPEAQTTVVVCRDGRRQIGMTVSQVLDVAGGRQLEEAGTGALANGITLLHDRVTGVVSLSGIPSLDSVTERGELPNLGEEPR